MTAVHALGEEDVAAAAALEAAAFGAGHRPAEACAAALREELTRPWARLWGARHDGALVAFLLAWHVVDELHVLNVATHPDAQRRGHGGRVLSAALAYAREHHVRLVLLEVRWSNRPAIGLYRRFGFYAARTPWKWPWSSMRARASPCPTKTR